MLTTLKQFDGDSDTRFTWFLEYFQGPAAGETECFVTTGANLLESAKGLKEHLAESGVSDDVHVRAVTSNGNVNYQLIN